MNVGQPWRRKGRRFVQVRTAHRPTCARCRSAGCWPGPPTRSTRKARRCATSRRSARRPAAIPARREWDGSELVAFKLHLPSRILDHNVKRLDGTNGAAERGNILTWEQTLEDRRAGKPIDMT